MLLDHITETTLVIGGVHLISGQKTLHTVQQMYSSSRDSWHLAACWKQTQPKRTFLAKVLPSFRSSMSSRVYLLPRRYQFLFGGWPSCCQHCLLSSISWTLYAFLWTCMAGIVLEFWDGQDLKRYLQATITTLINSLSECRWKCDSFSLCTIAKKNIGEGEGGV